METSQHPIAPYEAMIEREAEEQGLPPLLVGCIIMQESSGNPYAQRVERGFWARYASGIARWVKSTVSSADDRWARYPDVYASSYGLMQLMLQTAAEAGFRYEFPAELTNPRTNIHWGCVVFARMLRKEGGNVERALLRWNGGGDPDYPKKVLAHARAIRAVGLLPDESDSA